jgi:hypothetical protein
MLAGRRPFEGDNLQVLAMHLNATPKSLREIVGGASIPSEVEAIVMRALAKQPDERFQSARELRRALDRVPNLRAGEAGVSGMEKTILATPPVRRSRPGWMRPAIVALALGLLIGEHMGAAPYGSDAAIASTAEGRPALPDAQRAPKRREGSPKRARPVSKKHSTRP